MVEVYGNNISMSYGDTFSVTFNLSGYELVPTDVILFSVKATPESTAVLWSQSVMGLIGSSFTITDTEDTFTAAVGEGQKCYDVLLTTSAGEKITLNYPAVLDIKAVAHNV